jgi:DnaJ like chaperone protein
MGKFGKWIGGGLGWALGGPIGALLGFVLGSVVDNVKKQSYSFSSTKQQTQTGDFAMSLIILAAAVMKADGKLKRSELDYIKSFFQQNFGQEMATESIRALREVFDRNIPLREVCVQIREKMTYPERLQLMHFLFGIAKADGHICAEEVEVLKYISTYININKRDYNSFFAMFSSSKRTTETAYQILEIEPSVSNEELKTAYRKMAKKFHPDKVAHLGGSVQKDAKEKFQKIGEAYEIIKKQRGIN